MKPRIRAITVGIDIDEIYETKPQIEKLLNCLRERFSSAGYPVDTCRVVVKPLRLDGDDDIASLFPKFDSCDRVMNELSMRWFCLPICISAGISLSALWRSLPKLLIRYPKLFLHFLTSDETGVDCGSLLSVAKIIIDISRLSGNGYDNFRVGCGCNIRANTPFFPFSYHDGEKGFSIAADIIGAFVETAENLAMGTDSHTLLNALVQSVDGDLARLENIARGVESEISAFEYKGMDCSLAPYPRGKRSVAYLLEQVAPQLCGDNGTLSATALLTKAIRTAVTAVGVKSAGFNGVMFSPLEDSYLAKNMGRHTNIEKLMLYSTVCGCGIDMVPISGTVSANELASLIQDVMVLSSIHRKPLGVRVLPIPTKMANEATEFNHDFLANCKVQDVSGYGLLNGRILSNGGIL